MRRLILFLSSVFLADAVLLAQGEEAPALMTNTVFTSDYLEMASGDEISEFHLVGNVSVVGTDLNLTSDELHITAVKKGDKDATVSEMGNIMKIIAIGNVKMKQAGRTAESGRMEFFTEDKKVLLTGNPVITEEDRTVSGDEIEWYAGLRQAIVRGSKDNRVTVTLGALPVTGFDRDQPGEGAEASNEVQDANGTGNNETVKP
jgi:lipopolysaccharide transport protein LptA